VFGERKVFFKIIRHEFIIHYRIAVLFAEIKAYGAFRMTRKGYHIEGHILASYLIPVIYIYLVHNYIISVFYIGISIFPI